MAGKHISFPARRISRTQSVFIKPLHSMTDQESQDGKAAEANPFLVEVGQRKPFGIPQAQTAAKSGQVIAFKVHMGVDRRGKCPCAIVMRKCFSRSAGEVVGQEIGGAELHPPGLADSMSGS